MILPMIRPIFTLLNTSKDSILTKQTNPFLHFHFNCIVQEKKTRVKCTYITLEEGGMEEGGVTQSGEGSSTGRKGDMECAGGRVMM